METDLVSEGWGRRELLLLCMEFALALSLTIIMFAVELRRVWRKQGPHPDRKDTENGADDVGDGDPVWGHARHRHARRIDSPHKPPD